VAFDVGPRSVLRGARQLAGHILGDEKQWRAIYPLAAELPVFMFGGRIAGYERDLDDAMRAKQSGGRETAAQMRRAAKHHEALT
jgi:hypothetical protein